jgi:hypothetical protein
VAREIGLALSRSTPFAMDSPLELTDHHQRGGVAHHDIKHFGTLFFHLANMRPEPILCQPCGATLSDPEGKAAPVGRRIPEAGLMAPKPSYGIGSAACPFGNSETQSAPYLKWEVSVCEHPSLNRRES